MNAKNQLLVIIPPGSIADEFVKLLSAEFQVIYADNEEDGFRILQEQASSIAAVLLDLDLARSSNFSFTKRIAFDSAFSSIPVIGTKTEIPSESDVDCFDYGFSDLIVPPGYPKLVSKRINNAIRAKDSLTFSEIVKMLKELPSNIFWKDTEGRYIFMTHYWRHLNNDNPYWLRGKTDMEIRKDKHNAKIAMDSDKRIIATGQGTEYVIEENYDGIREFLQLIKRPTYDEDGNINGVIALINDVTKQQLLELELEKRSKTDSLTGLLNKGVTEELIRMMLANYYKNKEASKCALMMIDVDQFKSVNDNFGHDTGDKVLAAISSIIKNSFKGMDVAGRIGGDEFMVFLRDIEKPENALLLAERIEKQTNQLVLHDNIHAFISVSIGISIFPDHGKSFDELYTAADKALYYVKEHGRAAWKLYEPELKQE